MKKLIVTFGDSWPAGMELQDPEIESFGAQLMRSIGYDEFINFGEPASSIDHMVVQMLRFEKVVDQYQGYDKLMVFDCTQTGRHLFFDFSAQEFVRQGELHVIDEVYPHMRPVVKTMLAQMDFTVYNNFCAGRSVVWLQNHCKTQGYKFLFIKHLQDFPSSEFDSLIEWDHFYNQGRDICRDFCAEAYPGSSWVDFNWQEVKYGQRIEDESTRSKFFQGTEWHPNALGHELKAKKLEMLYDVLYN